MDIALLSEMVGELILDHDQIGLPGVGTFVAEVVPATFSDKGYTINPPYRRLSFYPGILEENLLIDFYSRHNDLDRDAAKAYIKAFLSEMKSVLEDRKSVTFPGLGRLRATKENSFFFVPDEDLDIFPDGFGLDSVSLKTHQESKEEVSIAVSDLASILAAAKSQPEPVREEQPARSSTDSNAADDTAPTIEAPVPAEQASEPAQEDVPPVDRKGPEQTGANPFPEYLQDYGEDPDRPLPSRWWIWPLALLGAVALFFAAFILLAHIAPDFIDSLLYSKEELRIINY